MKKYSDYDPFARIYNLHWGDNFLPLILPILESYMFKEIPENARILDLCCGTGQLARQLTERGYRVTGVDGSGEMLKYARENAPLAELIHDDARSFRPSDYFNAVVSTFDSLNHVMMLEELTAVFRNVHAVLKKNGIFLFDLNMEAGFLKDWRGEYSIVETDNVCIQRCSYNQEEKTARFATTIFLLKSEWLRTDFVLTQKCYSKKEIISSLKSAGFSDVRPCAYDILSGLTELTPDADRAFFLCRKSDL